MFACALFPKVLCPDGFLDVNDFLQAIRELGLGTTMEDAEQLFSGHGLAHLLLTVSICRDQATDCWHCF